MEQDRKKKKIKRKIALKKKMNKKLLKKGIWEISVKMRGALVSVAEVPNPHELLTESSTKDREQYHFTLKAKEKKDLFTGTHTILYVSEGKEEDHYLNVLGEVIDEIKFFYGDGYLPTEIIFDKAEDTRGIKYHLEQLGTY